MVNSWNLIWNIRKVTVIYYKTIIALWKIPKFGRILSKDKVDSRNRKNWESERIDQTPQIKRRNNFKKRLKTRKKYAPFWLDSNQKPTDQQQHCPSLSPQFSSITFSMISFRLHVPGHLDNRLCDGGGAWTCARYEALSTIARHLSR